MEYIKRFACLLMIVVWFLSAIILMNPYEVYADLKSADVFQDSQWELMTEYELKNNTESLQAVCSTDMYIVCFVNASNAETIPDTLVAFYKNDTDENGNPVTQYSYAKSVSEMDYEHGNGMTYNPKTNEIVIAGCTSLNPDNFGCVFIIDASTLQFKRKVQVSSEFNVRAIAYCKDMDRYLIQKDKEEGYDFAETNLDFQIVNELEEMVNYTRGKTFQDFEVCGKDIICLPYIRKEKYNGNVQVYSRKSAEMLGEYQLDLASDSDFIEAESIGELSPGSFVLGCAIRNPRRIALYRATLPMAYNVKTEIENGTITETAKGIDLGSDTTVEYTANEDYEVKEITVDEQLIDAKEYEKAYTFSSITENHSIFVKCTEIPQYSINTQAVNGIIDPEQLIRRDKDVTISYSPDEHYELQTLYVDGKDMDFEDGEDSFTLKNIQGPHSIEVEFGKIPSFEVKATVEHGSISAETAEVYRDENYTVSFTPEEDYELKEIYVDGVRVEHVVDENSFTFGNVQRPHDIRVVFQWQYKMELILIAAGMTLTLAGYLTLTIKRYRKNRIKRKERKAWKKSRE